MGHDDHRSGDGAATIIVALLGLLMLGLIVGGGLYFFRAHHVQTAMEMDARAQAERARAEAAVAEAMMAEQELRRKLEESQQIDPIVAANKSDAAVEVAEALPLDLALDAEGRLSLDGEPLPDEDRLAVLEQFAGRDVHLQVADDCPHQRVVVVLDDLKQVGLRNVMLKLAEPAPDAP